MDTAAPPVQEEPPAMDWSLLPLDALSSVFVKVGAGLVCRSWLQAAMVPDVWRVVEMESHGVALYEEDSYDEDICEEDIYGANHRVRRGMAKAAVDRSDGQLRVFAGKDFVNDELIIYIVKRSPSLTALRLVSCNSDVLGKRLASVVKESPMLELRSLELDDIELTSGELTAVLENCPVLEVLRMRNCFEIDDDDLEALRAKFARIKTLTLECDDYFSDIGYYNYYGRDSEDESTDWSL